MSMQMKSARHAGCERADVVAAQHGGAAERRDFQRVARGHRRRVPIQHAGDEAGLACLVEKIGRVVRRGAVGAQPHAARRRHACGE